MSDVFKFENQSKNLNDLQYSDRLTDENLSFVVNNQTNLNLAPSEKNLAASKKSFSLGKLISLGLILASLGVLFLAGWSGHNFFLQSKANSGFSYTRTLARINQQEEKQEDTSNLLGFLPEFTRFFTGNLIPLKGEESNRTNLLLLGLDKEAGLTDTIILLSYFHQEKRIVTLNIPRDLFVNDGFITEKINAVYPAAKNRKPESRSYPGIFLSNFISKEFGIPIHYWATVNFQGLADLVDALGGVEVEVENSFRDCEYPKMDYSGFLPCQVFEAGRQKMDGQRALVYARSRKSMDNGEGSDFARSRRQSILVQAILQKIKSLGLSNLKHLNSYLDILQKNVYTNASSEEILSAFNKLRDFSVADGFQRIIWEPGNTKFLCEGTSYSGAYIITYCDGTYPGDGQSSEDKEAAKKQVKDLLQIARLKDLYASPVVILSNSSQIGQRLQTELQNLGFSQVDLLQLVSESVNFQRNRKGKVSVFIPNKSKYQLFKSIDWQLPKVWDLDLANQLPPNSYQELIDENYTQQETKPDIVIVIRTKDD